MKNKITTLSIFLEMFNFYLDTFCAKYTLYTNTYNLPIEYLSPQNATGVELIVDHLTLAYSDRTANGLFLSNVLAFLSSDFFRLLTLLALTVCIQFLLVKYSLTFNINNSKVVNKINTFNYLVKQKLHLKQTFKKNYTYIKNFFKKK